MWIVLVFLTLPYVFCCLLGYVLANGCCKKKQTQNLTLQNAPILLQPGQMPMQAMPIVNMSQSQ